MTEPAPHTGDSKPLSELSSQVAEEQKRTPGLKLFDFLLYPLLTNAGVFAISVAATYLTARGGDRNAAGKLVYGEAGHWFQRRGEWLVNKFRGLGMTPGQADMSKMVFFSFADGSLLAPLVKLFEDRREGIARYLDRQLGTQPQDPSVYAAEPKQSWLSVLGGRFVTAAIVVPTAVVLTKTGLNDRLFTRPGERVGAWLAQKPWLNRLLGGIDIRELSKIGFFEAFYTSVCTAGLYINSRFFAGLMGGKASPALTPQAAQPQVDNPPEPAKPVACEGLKQQKSFRDRYEEERRREPQMLGI